MHYCSVPFLGRREAEVTVTDLTTIQSDELPQFKIWNIQKHGMFSEAVSIKVFET